MRQRKPKIVVTQSMMKDFVRYKSELLCGLQFKAKYLDRIQFESSDIQRLGQYFEYMATGALTKHGNIPEPDRLKSGKLSAKYELALAQVEVFKKTMLHYGFKIISKGVVAKHKDAEGTLDIEAVATKDIRIGNDLIRAGERCIIDLKYSGLLEGYQAAKSEFGWDYTTLHQKEGTMLQAVHYKWLMKKMTTWDYHFFFNVYSSTEQGVSKLFYINASEHIMQGHENVIKNAKFAVQTELKNGFIPYPSVEDCKDCPLNKNCSYFIDVPPVQVVNF